MNSICKIILFYIISFNVLASERLDKHHFDISGYLGYSYVWSSIDEKPVDSYPELGLLLNYQYNTNWSTFVQLNINENAIEKSLEHLLVYGFVSYQNSIKSIPFAINVGKLRHQFGLYNANIINPSTRPGVIAPQAIYWNNLSATLNSGYGIQIEAYIKNFKFSYSIDQHIIVDEKSESYNWSGTPNLEMSPYFGSHQIYNIEYKSPNLRMIGSFSQLQFNRDMDSVEFVNLGIEYNINDFDLSIETLIIRSPDVEWQDFSELSLGYSLSIGYHINDTLEIHTNYNAYHSSLTLPRYSKHANEWKDVSIGITKYYNQLEFKFDIHKVHGGRTLNFTAWDNSDIKNWWYLGTSIVYHF